MNPARLNHVGVSVADLDRSIAFYAAAFDMETVSRVSFASEKYDGKYGAILGLADAAGTVAILAGGGLRLELFQFDRPAPQASDPARPVSHHGISHFCVEVNDIERTYRRLLGLGARFHCPPQRIRSSAATYGRDPDGNVFELFEECADDQEGQS